MSKTLGKSWDNRSREVVNHDSELGNHLSAMLSSQTDANKLSINAQASGDPRAHESAGEKHGFLASRFEEMHRATSMNDSIFKVMASQHAKISSFHNSIASGTKRPGFTKSKGQL